jgi:hypothetical protein
MIRIEIKSSAVVTREGTSKSGRPYKLIEQRGWLHGAKDYPVEVSFVLDNGQLAFGPGFYVADASCVVVDRFGTAGLQLNKMKPEARAVRSA